MLFDDEDIDECGDSLEECDYIEESKRTPRFSKKMMEDFKRSCGCKTNRLVNLSEALGFTKSVSKKNMSLDEVIDNMVGINESIMNKAINKVKKSNSMTLQECYNKLGKNSFDKIVESLQKKSECLHGDVKVNGKKIAEYTVNELQGLLEKLVSQIAELNRKISLNEGDTKKLNEVLANKMKIQTILENEITYRVSYRMFEDDEKREDDDFKDLNPEPLDIEDKEKDATEQLADDIVSQVDTDEDDEQNPDEDSEEEVSSVIITLVNMDAAEKMKEELIEAGIPEEEIVLEEIIDEESDEEESESDEEEQSEESEEEQSEESEEESDEEEKSEKQEESYKYRGSKLNEADEDEEESESDEEEKPEEDSDEQEEETEGEESDEEEQEDEEEPAVKLILKNTDYIEILMNVLEDRWGLSQEEFEELIGGEIVSGDEDEEEQEDEEKDDDDNEFNPDEIFKNL